MTAEAPPECTLPQGDDLARALVRVRLDRAVGRATGRQRGGFREGSHERPACGPSYVHRTTRIPLPADRDVNFRGHVRGAVEMMVEVGVLDSTDEVVALAMLTLANEFGLLAWANQRKIGRRSHVSARTVRKVQSKLRALGVVDWSHEFRNGRPYPNRYVFFLPGHWTRRQVLAAKKRVGPEPDGRVEYAQWCADVADQVLEPKRGPRPRPPASKQNPGRITPPSTAKPSPPNDETSDVEEDEHDQAAQQWADSASIGEWAAMLPARHSRWLGASVERRGGAARAAVVGAVAALLRAGVAVAGPSP
jgi:hypothetical protein